MTLASLLLLLAGCRFDHDGDGYVGRDDCDDDDPAMFPGAPERCNGLDDDCDGSVDESSDVPPWYADADGDGHGDRQAPIPGCPRSEGVATGDDCDDGRSDVFPGAPERCDQVDNDCNGAIDDDPQPPRYRDGDADGIGGLAAGCEAFSVEIGGDCDDRDPTRFPGNDERCDGVDNDCDGATPGEQDADGDGVLACEDDCDDLDPARTPGTIERCNGIDDDCDGVVDGDDTWFDPRWPVRFWVHARVDAPTSRPIVLDLDGEALLDGQPVGFDPAHVRVMAQDCDGTALRELPAETLDHARGLDQLGGGDDPIGDDRAALVVLWDTDGDLSTVEPWSDVRFAVYVGGPEPRPAWTTDLVLDGDELTAGGVTTQLRPDRGGLADLLADGLLLASQADATSGNGLRTSAGPLSAFLAEEHQVEVVDAGPVTAALRTTAWLDNGGGAVDSSYTYRRFAGRGEVWVRHRLVTTEPTTIAGPIDRTSAVRPWQMALGGTHPLATVAEDLRWGYVVAEEGGVVWGWLAAPRYITHGTSDATDTWTAANELSPCCTGTSGGVPTDRAVVDGAVIVVEPHLGSLSAGAWWNGLDVTLDVGPPETP